MAAFAVYLPRPATEGASHETRRYDHLNGSARENRDTCTHVASRCHERQANGAVSQNPIGRLLRNYARGYRALAIVATHGQTQKTGGLTKFADYGKLPIDNKTGSGADNTLPIDLNAMEALGNMIIADSDSVSQPLKRCNKCGREYPATTDWFNKNRSGLRPDCKNCHREYDRQYRQTNAETKRTYNRQYRLNNLEKERERIRQYRLTNPDNARTYRRQYRLNNPDVHRSSNQRRRARKLNLPDTLTSQDWQHALDYFDNRCAVCGRPIGLWHNLAVDHWIPLSSPDCPGTVATNVLPLCHGDGGCNNSKHDRDAHEWLVEKFGARKGGQIFARIQAYFDSLKDGNNE